VKEKRVVALWAAFTKKLKKTAYERMPRLQRRTIREENYLQNKEEKVSLNE